MSDNTNVQPQKVDITTENFVCPNCGATMTFDIKAQKFMCPACKTVRDVDPLANEIKEYDFSQYRELEAKSVPFEGMAVVTCANCGAEVTFSDYQISSVCPMCKSTQIAEVKQRAGIMPEGIVPFQLDRHDAQERFRKWARGRWFAPNKFKKSFGEGALEGMYLPFWTYDSNVVSQYNGLGGRTRFYTDREGKTRTTIDWYPVAGAVQNAFDDVLICASDKESRINGILPYRTKSEAVPYSPAYLSGYYAELYKTKADSGFQSAKRIMDQTMISLAEAQIRMSYDHAQVQSINSTYNNVTYKHMLLPLWVSAFGYQGKTYEYLINGETGTVTGARPYSIPKIAAAVIAGLILLIAVYYATSGSDGSNGYYEYDYGDGSGYESSYDNYGYDEMDNIINFDF